MVQNILNINNIDFKNSIQIDKVLKSIENALKANKAIKIPSYNDIKVKPINDSKINRNNNNIKNKTNSPTKNKKITKIDNLTSYNPPIDENRTTIMDFVNHIKRPFQKLKISINEETGGKVGYKKLKFGWREKSYDECKNTYKDDNKANLVAYTCPKGYVIIDADSKEAFNVICDFYKTSKYEIIRTRSSSFNVENYYKNHFYFKIEDDKKTEVEKFGNYDILHENANVGEKLTEKLDFDNIPTISKNHYKELYDKLETIAKYPKNKPKKAKNKINEIISETPNDSDDDDNDYKNDKPNIHLHNYNYSITDDKLKFILSKLPNEYLNDFHINKYKSGWYLTTTILKQLNKYDIWNEWSKKSNNYNEVNNNKIWNRIDLTQIINLDINYLIRNINKTFKYNIPEIKRTKEYIPLKNSMNDKNTIKTIYTTNEFINEIYTYNIFDKNNVHIIKSCTGTGKTTAINQNMEEYLTKNNNNVRFISLTARTSLSEQHMINFKNIGIVNYLESDEKNLQDEKIITICINSIVKRLKNISIMQMNDTILFIDEIASFIEFTHNDLLEKKGLMKETHNLLMKLIKNCKKVIVCDHMINDGVFTLLSNRKDDEKIFINNNYKKYKGVSATNLNDEYLFYDKILDHCKNKQPFLSAYDSAIVAKRHYLKALEQEIKEDEKKKYILITADSQYELTNANEQFLNSYVFYSPKITYGVDFSTCIPQDVFIYIKGKTIQPSGMFQQLTRCRNIKNVYYYGEPINNESKYINLKEVEEKYIKYIENNNTINDDINTKSILDVCTVINEEDDILFYKNSFFNLYCYNEYVKDIYNTNKIKHFELILESQGFDLKEEGIIRSLSSEDKKILIDSESQLIEEQWNKYLKMDWEQRETSEKYKNITSNINYYNLFNKSNEVLEEYKEYILNNHKKEEYKNIIEILKSDTYINICYQREKNNTYDIKAIDSKYNKLKLLRKFENFYDINKLDVGFDKSEYDFIPLPSDMNNLFKKVFRTKMKTPNNWNDIKKLYVHIIKNITSHDIIKGFRCMKNNKREYQYTLNNDIIDKCINLNKHSQYYIPITFIDKIQEKYNMKATITPTINELLL